MTTQNNDSLEISYDFFDLDLWLARIGGLDKALDATVSMLRSVLLEIDEFTIKKFVQLISASGGEDYETLVNALVADPDSDTLRQQLLNQVESDIGKAGGSKHWFLNNMLARFLRSKTIPVTADSAVATTDDFEVKQILNLYVLWNALNNFFWSPLVNMMRESLSDHKKAGTLPPLHLIRECFRHVAIDFEILQRAIVQRRRKSDNFVNYATPLLVMDKIAIKAIAPFKRLLPDHAHVSTITFLSSTTHIHHLPYSDQFILIGLSYDRISKVSYYPGFSPDQHKALPAFELMAIPHEVGHYMYHQAKLPSGKSFADESVQFASNRYYRWCEEIFSDMYGCLVAGGLTVLGLQALFASGDKDRVWKDDEKHPTPVLRLYLLSEILRVFSQKKPTHYDFTNVAKLLDTNWSAILQRWGYVLLDIDAGRPKRIKLSSKPDDFLEEMVNIDTALETLRPIIDHFAHLLLTNADFNAWGTGSAAELSAEIPWSNGAVTTLNEYDAIMEQLTANSVAYKKIPSHTIIDASYSTAKIAAPTADEKLANCITYWGDSGPSNSSVGT